MMPLIFISFYLFRFEIGREEYNSNQLTDEDFIRIQMAKYN
jgi:hypothetical protein